MKKVRRRSELSYHLMVFPGLFFLILFSYIPMVGLLMAFQDFVPAKGLFRSEFVGLKHFTYMFQLPDIGKIIRNTLVIALGKMMLGMVIAIAFAILLNEVRIKIMKKTVQTIVYLPHFLSWVIIGSVAYQIFRPSTGMINIVLQNMGLIKEGIPFLTEKWHWAVTYLLIGVWQGMGWGTIIYLAAMTSISGELYEAAMIDGAGRWKRMWHITLPGIKGTVVTLLIMNLGRIMGSNFERLDVFANTQVREFQYQLAIYIYEKGLGNAQFSMSTAVGLFQSLVGLLLVIAADRFAKLLGEDGLI